MVLSKWHKFWFTCFALILSFLKFDIWFFMNVNEQIVYTAENRPVYFLFSRPEYFFFFSTTVFSCSPQLYSPIKWLYFSQSVETCISSFPQRPHPWREAIKLGNIVLMAINPPSIFFFFSEKSSKTDDSVCRYAQRLTLIRWYKESDT